MTNEEFNIRLDGVEKRFDSLREADLEAIKVARNVVNERLDGFPAEYAKKPELDELRNSTMRLERQAMPRDRYEEAHQRVEDDLAKKLARETFEATIQEWTTWRRTVDGYLAARTGVERSMNKIFVVIGLSATLITTVVSIVVLVANHKF